MAILSNNEARGDVTSAGQVTIATIPAGGGLELCAVYEETAVAGTTTLVIDIGTTAGDPDEFIDALDVGAMTAPVYNTGDLFEASNAEGIALVALSNTAQDVLLEITDANIATATAGKLVIGLRIVDLGRFDA